MSLSAAMRMARPHLRGYTASVAVGQRVTFDFGTATSLQVIALIHMNMPDAWFSGNSADSWGGPSYGVFASALGRAGNDRYHDAHRPSVAVPFNQRYLSIHNTTPGTPDGANRFALGGIWAGLITSPPSDILMNPDEEKLEAYTDIKTQDGRTLQRLTLDNPAFQITCRRLAETEAELAAWREIDRQWSAAPNQTALVMLREAYPAECYVMCQTSVSRWRHACVWSESEMTLREVTAG